jgi:hypothetical protein
MCRFESLKDGTLDLADIALMNDALNVVADNERLASENISCLLKQLFYCL